MAVVAKFSVASIEQFGGGSIAVNMNAIYPSDDDDKVTRDENEKFFQATPSAQLKMHVNNPAAAEQFQPGDVWYLSFERAAPRDS